MQHVHCTCMYVGARVKSLHFQTDFFSKFTTSFFIALNNNPRYIQNRLLHPFHDSIFFRECWFSSELSCVFKTVSFLINVMSSTFLPFSVKSMISYISALPRTQQIERLVHQRESNLTVHCGSGDSFLFRVSTLFSTCARFRSLEFLFVLITRSLACRMLQRSSVLN